MKSESEIIEIINDVLIKLEHYNHNTATEKYNLANCIVLPKDLYFEFITEDFKVRYIFTGKYPISYNNFTLRIFSIPCNYSLFDVDIKVKYKP